MSGKRIADAFRFSERDLNANRDGQLSAAQRRALRASRNASLALLALSLVPVPALLILGGASPAILCLSAFLAVAVLRELLRTVHLQRDLRTGGITAYFGRIHLHVRNKRGSELFVETAQGLHRFPISTAQMLALRDGEYYTLYVAPRSDTILSLEPADVAHADDGAAYDAVDLSALAEDEGDAEKPKRHVFVLGDDGELEVRRGRDERG